MDYQNIIVYKDGAIGIIKINRPEVSNALNTRTIQEISNAVGKWNKHDGVQVLIFTGEGNKSFVSGADINQLKTKTALSRLNAELSTLCQEIEESPKISIASINGIVLGGGCELAMACDIRIAAKSTKIGFPELNLSIILGGSTQRLIRLIGIDKAKDMILTGEIITAEKAEEIGLVSEVVALESLWEKTLVKAINIIKRGPLSVRLAKLVINQELNTDMNNGLAIQKLTQALLFTSLDKNEGVNAFLEKRLPTFKGN